MSVSLRSRPASRAAACGWVRRLDLLLVVISLMLPLLGCARAYVDASDPERRPLNMSNTVGGRAGGTLTLYAPPINLGSQRAAEVRPFVRTGLLGDFSNERNASFQNLGGASANGTAAFSRSFTVPVMVGLSVPATSVGLNMPGLTAEIFGGAQITRRKASLSLTEALAPGGPATSGSTSWTSIDPAVGAALMYHVGNIGAHPVTVGPSVTVDWTRSHDLHVASANFPVLELYTLNTGKRAEASVMLNVMVGVNSMMAAGATGGFAW
jgi:hypothetical protein